MPANGPTTIAQYIRAAPREGQPHLRRMYRILKAVAPTATEAIKWGTPFFVEPRFLFAFAAHKTHLSFAPTAETLQHFRTAVTAYRTTKELVHFPYKAPLPEPLIRKVAKYRLAVVGERTDSGFW